MYIYGNEAFEKCPVAEFFLEWKIFLTKIVDRSETQFYVNKIFLKIARLYVEKYGRPGQGTDDDMPHVLLCMLNN
jgi:hypothetical protein